MSKLITIEEFKKAPTEGVLLRKEYTVEVKAEGMPDDECDFTITTSAVDRMGDVVMPEGGRVENYLKNPVVLWAHDSSRPPVAKAVNLTREANGWKSKAKFTPREMYPFGHMIGQMYKGGFLAAVSIGFIPHKHMVNEDRPGFMPMDFVEWELLEFSACPIPANPEALVAAKSAGIDTSPMREWAEKILDGEGVLCLPRSVIEAAHKATGGRLIVEVRRGADGRYAIDPVHKAMDEATMEAMVARCEAASAKCEAACDRCVAACDRAVDAMGEEPDADDGKALAAAVSAGVAASLKPRK